MKQRVQISLDPKVYALIKNQPNKSEFIEGLIVAGFREGERNQLTKSVRESLIKDPVFISELRQRLSENYVEY